MEKKSAPYFKVTLELTDDTLADDQVSITVTNVVDSPAGIAATVGSALNKLLATLPQASHSDPN